ncbi:MAG: amidohydrolase family protein [Flavobacteriaceae bacterium]|nr:amidohydrolase family protein [Flavobacteriaceae bacterium]
MNKLITQKLTLLFFLVSIFSFGQEYFPENKGVKTNTSKATAYINAIINVNSTTKLTKATLLVKDGLIIGVGKNIKIPKGTVILDMAGKHIYPSFIDAYSQFGISKVKRMPRGNTTQYEAGRSGYYWNDHIRPDNNSLDHFKYNKKDADKLIKSGYGVVNTHQADGIVRGNGILVSLNTQKNDSYRILDARSAQYLSFSKSAKSNQAYPSSTMGSISLLRQTYIDAKWYEQGNIKNTDLALEALNKNRNLTQIFFSGNKLNTLRADKIAKEFGLNYALVTSKDAYESAKELKNTNSTLIVPINYRKAYDVSNPLDEKTVDFADLKRWNQEPSNLSILSDNNMKFAVTSNGLKKVSDLIKNMRIAIERGLDKKTALDALTSVPAQILNKSNLIGSLEKGKLANFLVCSGELFDKKTILYDNWIQGDKHVINNSNIKDIRGKYEFNHNDITFNLEIKGEISKLSIALKQGEDKLKGKIQYKDNWLGITYTLKGASNPFRIYSLISSSNPSSIKGKIVDTKGAESTWSATKKEDFVSKDKKDKAIAKTTLFPVTFPNLPYGFKEMPKQETTLFKNATVWTGDNQGILENTDVLVKDGKIVKIGKSLKAKRAKVIDATGKYLTAGIIDEHSHIATSAVNEGGHNSTAEVSIEDVINPDDINIYRALAGGVTTIQILHGSANPIGGQSALIKLKWGENADGLLFKGNDKFIKFALGENVKQSRSRNGVRFPQTRMGVEQVYTDYFQRAKEYDIIKKSGVPYRKDLEMEVLSQIINKERFITCHSYVQSEINMIMKVAEKFGFNINTFTHILEGYKVADKMKEHGVGASTFSDWWAYKYEVNDAIPYNAAIMHEQGITVSINSDDREMMRRLNQEAAKTVKYGGVSADDAWKFVTLNPAKLLHIDKRVGSITIGKDADLVLWNNNPMSIYAKAEKTMVDGIIYFDIETDKLLRKEIEKDRNTLVQMMLAEKNKGKETQKPTKKKEINFHCDTEEQY